MSNEPEVLYRYGFSMKVCVPKDWDDSQIVAFAEQEYHSGTVRGWYVRKERNAIPEGTPERSPCDERDGFIHVVVDAL